MRANPNAHCDTNSYSHTDTNTNSNSYTHAHRNAVGNAHVHTGRHARAMEHGFAIPDTRRALWLCADRDALLCVRWSVQRHSSEQCEPPGSRHWDVGIARADALYQ
jgi:hypothetical protein